MIFKAYKYRLYPTLAQRAQIDSAIGACRLVYNLALGIKISAWREQQRRVSAIDLCYGLPGLKADYPWIAAVDSQALQAAVKKVDAAFAGFFQGKGYPKFKKKRNGGSFQCPNNKRHIDFEKGLLTVPKIKDIPVRVSRRFEGKIKSVTISRTPTGKYFASILVAVPGETPKPMPVTEAGAVGIDIGLKDFAVLTTGERVAAPQYLRTALSRLKVLQRRASRKKKGSANKRKANLLVARQHERVSNRRNDFLHQLSTRLVRDNQTDTICVESLAVKNMVKNHCLALSISDAGWGEFIRQLEYKCRWAGKNLIRIDRFAPSSKVCHCCGWRNEELNLSVREWTCGGCNVTHDRDSNAAQNIKIMGLTNSGRRTSGGPVEARSIERPTKQEYIQDHSCI